MHIVLKAILLLSLILGIAKVACADSNEDARAAFRSSDYVTALKLWRPLANQGNSEAQSNLARMYRLGLGVTQNDTEAANWSRLAANAGHTDSQLFLAVHYEEGRGVHKDIIEAHKWIHLAAIGGEKDAARALQVLERDMTRKQISEAQRRAAAWKPTRTQGQRQEPVRVSANSMPPDLYSNNDEQNVKRLIAAGRAMERIRNTNNLDKEAACFRQMHTLQPQAKALDNRLQIGSLKAAAAQATMCVSCVPTAMAACDSAEELYKYYEVNRR